jgi:arginine N-succinyltransferase
MKPFVVRPVEEKDLKDLKSLASSIKGLTTLPNDIEILKDKVSDSLRAFNPHVRKPGGEAYLFALEDLDKGHVVGTSSIVSKVGGFDPFYSYKIKTEHLESEILHIKKDVKVLHLEINHNGPTEIGSLLVNPAYRKEGLGRLISLSRFLFMAEFSKRFDKTVISELRGVVDSEGKSPFWECVGRHFFNTDFYHADYLTGTGNKEVIANLMPKYPIYKDLLPKSAQEVISDVHTETRPARALLENEGFAFRDEVDIFDAGPTVSAPLKNIRTIRESKKTKVGKILKNGTGAHYLISNTKLAFRCVVSHLEEGSGGVTISEKVARALEVIEGDDLRYVALK